MKNKKLANAAIITIIAVCCYLGLSASDSSNAQNSGIVGTWISEKDGNWKLIFDQSKCYQYYGNKLIETDAFLISNNSPQCGKTVPVNNYTSYLRLTNSQNSNDVMCYEINGISPQYLSLRPIDKGTILLFVRQ